MAHAAQLQTEAAALQRQVATLASDPRFASEAERKRERIRHLLAQIRAGMRRPASTRAWSLEAMMRRRRAGLAPQTLEELAARARTALEASRA